MEDLVAKTIGVYSKIANQWDEKYGNLKLMHKMADLFIHYLPGRRILDAGCGPGRDIKYFCRKGMKVTGIDLCDEFLKISEEKEPSASIKKMDIRQLGFEDGCFDGVWAAASLLHIPKKEAKQTLQGFRRVLKERGVIYVSVNKGSGECFVDSGFGEGRFFADYEEEEITGLMDSCGFRILELRVIEGVRNNAVDWLNIFAQRE